LKNYAASENGIDRGIAIRDKANNLVDLLQDEERL